MGGGAASFRLRPGYVPHANERGKSVRQKVKIRHLGKESKAIQMSLQMPF